MAQANQTQGAVHSDKPQTQGAVHAAKGPRIARVQKGAIPKADDAPKEGDALPGVRASDYEGEPSPHDIDKALAAKATDADFIAKAKYLKDNFGVQEPELLLLVVDKLEVVDAAQLKKEAEEKAKHDAEKAKAAA
jgi:hypothetical protein